MCVRLFIITVPPLSLPNMPPPTLNSSTSNACAAGTGISKPSLSNLSAYSCIKDTHPLLFKPPFPRQSKRLHHYPLSFPTLIIQLHPLFLPFPLLYPTSSSEDPTGLQSSPARS